MSEPSDIVHGGSEADVQEQRLAVDADATRNSPVSAEDGTGGSEADRQEQRMPLPTGTAADGGLNTGGDTGGSEADRLEQAAEVPFDHEDAYPTGGEDPTS